ncbi:hypothetical protein PC116_g22313 [Phytophthora cactorum]|uniref:Uncharacterized protein n=1 Tax=Phytophthora cactorum TaxID=29920 RepID=A0A8T1K1Z5_9STRA|nr:hypothetical protein PC111_g19603 [Phytophthora cactorum]KAG2826546.1 hypothetical protein PC112_g9226 [Phytophthora cactorum]KAG2880867.1 hypothetical protein PC114_g21860 [Phytophthora cactorum]KAG2890592.1 hypothetical protein PC115_g19459 [Phytophthora cactorum]KAG2908416.1 hypothetical protein PC117_g19953 [Phytophthora cactorum]
MEGILEESYQDLGSVQALVIKLRSLNQAAKLRLKMSLRPYLGERADIVYTADFEAAGVKIQEGRAHQLSRAQKAAVIQLAVREAPATGAASDGALAAAKRRKTTGSSGDEEESFVERLKST